ncbi:MAG: hypothetical protein CMO80_00130 [Verrucomicrobiales bacterium]|nr:hypothetical protein [Verrucomicrobiales bacterium]
MIDLKTPENSKILKLIKMGEKDYDKGQKMIHAKNREAEYEAFAAWIKAGAKDPRLVSLPAPKETAGPDKAHEIIRHARIDRVLDSFKRNVWSQRMRCFPCHTPHEIDGNSQKHRLARERLKKMKHNLGNLFTERMDIFKETPEATMEYLIRDSKRKSRNRLPMLNLKDPEKSLIILKPTARLPKKIGDKQFEEPSFLEPVSHMGGIKMHPDDFSYKAFVAWIEDYAKVMSGQYTSEDELPADNWYFTQQMMLMREAPSDWPEKARVQFFIHGWDKAHKRWFREPIAFTQGTMNPRRAVFGTLFLLRSKQSEKKVHWDNDPTLAPGEYLIKAYVDRREVLADNPTAILGKEDFYGQGAINAKWGKLFKNAQKFTGALLRKRAAH